jgi:hypothetical protein
MRLPVLAALAALVLTVDLAAAQESRATRSRSTTSEATTTTSGSSSQTTRRPRSAAQLRNDQIMRTCGAEWRRDKTRLQAAGKTWRTFLPECRTRQRG